MKEITADIDNSSPPCLVTWNCTRNKNYNHNLIEIHGIP